MILAGILVQSLHKNSRHDTNSVDFTKLQHMPHQGLLLVEGSSSVSQQAIQERSRVEEIRVLFKFSCYLGAIECQWIEPILIANPENRSANASELAWLRSRLISSHGLIHMVGSTPT
ncbi:uncharacterized protein LOC120685949 isoform X3 [Panicum virgatum]|uniref:Uncharacterized protein n=1 Tax=Panicum virgatum TaxID=38727 RepID=A0A8T0P7X3_PANVG|nr:uncharacterized protein LOC120685949 isoform X3 [Panicum virgatum]XP_039824028.1 uncharacterized protein LOC120685949 isoform X3 [Panicum virgatum]KAG2556769.1 hypothetical protein PVAP13_8NG149401 [Panicum virgatum]